MKCGSGSYNYYPMTSPGYCKECMEGASCNGGINVTIKEGYWRKNTTTDQILKCPRKNSCLANSLFNSSESCNTGYQGILCADCEENYSKINNFQCKRCPSKTKNIVQICFIFLILLMIVIYLVSSTLKSARNYKPTYSVLLRIVASHF